MGYETFYHLQIEVPQTDADALVGTGHLVRAAVAEMLKRETLLDQDEGEFRGTCSWYEHEKDLSTISKKFPSVRFVLKGEGEENEDIWEKWFLAGKVKEMRAKIVFPSPDECKWRKPERMD